MISPPWPWSVLLTWQSSWTATFSLIETLQIHLENLLNLFLLLLVSADTSSKTTSTTQGAKKKMRASILLVFLQPTLALPTGQAIDCWFRNFTHLFIQPVVETCTGHPVCLLSVTNKLQKIQRLHLLFFFHRSKVRVPEFNSNFEEALSEMEFNHHIGNRPATFYRSSLWLSCEQNTVSLPDVPTVRTK